MGFEEERKAVLRFVKEGRLEVDEAMALLDALEKAEAEAARSRKAAGAGGAGTAAGSPGEGPAGAGEAAGEKDGGDGQGRSGTGGPGGGDGGHGDGGGPDDGAKGRLPSREEVEEWLDRLGERLYGLGEKLEIAKERVEDAIASARNRVAQTGEEGREDLDRAWESIQRSIGQVIAEVGQRIGQAGGGSSFVRMDWDPLRGRPTHRVEKVLALPALPHGGNVEIQCRNGSVRVEGTDGEASISIKMRVRGDDGDSAASRAGDLLSVEENEAGWKLVTHEERGEAVDIRLALPRGRGLNFRAATHNGRLSLRDAGLARVRLQTDNGDIELAHVRADHTELETANGEVRVDGLLGTTLQCRSSNGPLRVRAAVEQAHFKSLNGAIEVEPAVAASLAEAAGWKVAEVAAAQGAERTYCLENVNGRVRVAVPVSERVGYRFDLETVQGRISLALEDIKTIVSQAPGRGGLKAESFGFDARPERVEFHVRSCNGSLQVEAGSL